MIYSERYGRAESAMRENGIGAWLICGRESHFLTEPALNYMMPTYALRRTAVILTSSGGRICVCHDIESEEIERFGVFDTLLRYGKVSDFEANLTEALKSIPKDKPLALDYSDVDPSSDGLSHSDYEMVSKILTQLQFSGGTVSAQPIMRHIRGEKSDEEADKIAAAVSCAMEIYEEARPLIHVGMSGMDVQQLFHRLVSERGCGYSWHEAYNPYVSVGCRSSFNCKMPPDDVFIREGDVVNVDFGIQLDGFASDNQRTFYALRTSEGETEPPEEVQRALMALQEVNAGVCRAMKPGVDSNSLGEIGRRIMAEYGYDPEKYGSYGHEIGIYAHNGGIGAGRHSVNNGQDTTLLRNMTFTLEPAVVTSYGRVCQEEVVRVTDNGGVMLSVPQKEVWIIR
ncbi:MAG: M24 family metallopeptidase [Eubacteriales bacterium]